MIRIRRAKAVKAIEPYLAPFGFKGAYTTGQTHSAVLVESEDGERGVGLGGQSPLWSDAEVFLAGSSEHAPDAMMYLVTERAVQALRGLSFETPFEVLDHLRPICHDYARAVTRRPGLRQTFTLNALVAVDNAIWSLYARTRGCRTFDDAVGGDWMRKALPARQERLGVIPLYSYAVPLDAIEQTARAGHFFAKIKIGADPDRDGDPEKMLAWDCRRLADIHARLKDIPTPHTDSGHIPYYLDANGRYDSKDRLRRLLDAACRMGALERIALVEEPFPEELKVDVSDLPVRLAADESLHSDAEARERIDLGYRALALKPIAKTLSLSLRTAAAAMERGGVPCFCADLTVEPILLEWNKNVAARLNALPGFKAGVVETNGHQNYRNWEALKRRHPRHGAPWTEMRDGFFELGKEFHDCAGGIFDLPEYYLGALTAES